MKKTCEDCRLNKCVVYHIRGMSVVVDASICTSFKLKWYLGWKAWSLRLPDLSVQEDACPPGGLQIGTYRCVAIMDCRECVKVFNDLAYWDKACIIIMEKALSIFCREAKQ